jgi:hypothetical protein
MEEVGGDWRRLHDLYASSNTIIVIKSKRTQRAGHLARRGEKGRLSVVWWGNLKKRDDWEDLGIDGKIIKLIFRDVRWEGLDWFQLAQKADRCDDGNEPSSSVKCVSLAS